MIDLGSKVKDKLTGFSGVATARFEWLTGCVRYEVQPEKLAKEGSPRATETFDESRLEVISRPTPKLRSIMQLGGPQRAPSRPLGPST